MNRRAFLRAVAAVPLAAALPSFLSEPEAPVIFTRTGYEELLKIMFRPENLAKALPDNILLYNWLHDSPNIPVRP